MKKLVTICLIMVSTFSVEAQEIFLQYNLKTLQKIAFNSTYESIKDYMKERNYSFQKEFEDEINLPNDTNLKVLNIIFKDPIGDFNITIQYDKKDKVFLLLYTKMYNGQTDWIKSVLEDKNFTIIKEDETAKIWSKSSYKYQIVTDSSNSKIHSLLFVSPNHPDFVK